MNQRLRRRLTSLALVLGMSVGLVVGTATTAAANDIRIYTTHVDCTSPDPADTTGTFRIYVRWLRDLTVNPDKVRPLFFMFQNRFNHTARVDHFGHFDEPGNQNWYRTGASGTVLTVPSVDGTHQMFNQWYGGAGHQDQNVAPNPNEVSSVTALPRPSYSTNNKVYRGPNPYGGTEFNTIVSSFTNNGQPWWTPMENDSPYFIVYYYVQGDYSTCGGWYPP